MTVYKEMYMGAALAAGSAALIIRSRWATYAALALVTLVSDPEGMKTSAGKWQDTTALTQLKTDLDQLKKDLQEKGTWEGGAFESFEATHETYVKSLGQFTTASTGTGQAVEAHANFTEKGAVAAVSVAGFMTAVAAAKIVVDLYNKFGSFTGPWFYAVYAAWVVFEKLAGQTTLQVTRQMLKKGAMAAALLGGVMYTGVQLSESAGKLFPWANGVPDELNTTGGANLQFPELEYNQGMGLTQKVDQNGMMPNLPKGGGILGI